MDFPRRAVSNPWDDLRVYIRNLPRDAQIDRRQPAHADNLSVFFRRRAAYAQTVPAHERNEPVPQAFRIAVYGVARRSAECLAQFLRGDRRQSERPFTARGFDRRRTARSQPHLFYFPLPVQRRQLRRPQGRQAADRLLPGFVLFDFHIASPVSLYALPVRDMPAFSG